MKLFVKNTAILNIFLLILIGKNVIAQNYLNSIVSSQINQSIEGFSYEDYRNTKPMKMPREVSAPKNIFDLKNQAPLSEKQKFFSNDFESIGAINNNSTEFKILLKNIPLPIYQQEDFNDIGDNSRYYGTSNFKYSSARVANTSAEENTYPHSAIGKLYFKKGSIAYVCTASLVRKSILVTAGHCVHSGIGGDQKGFFNSFEYVPSYRNGVAPYGTWNYSKVYTSGIWASGGGVVPNTEDWALIVLQRKDINSQLTTVGAITGWLNFATFALGGEQLTAVGYPGNLDNGQVKHRVESVGRFYGIYNIGAWGSDMEQGSSGGPVVMNYGSYYSNSSLAPINNVRNYSNYIVSVTSFGATDKAVKRQGGSELNDNFKLLINRACTENPWAC
ncbi:MAG: trypsin-like serine protease [Burkholderiaceae bacterium]|nr:trypsin-like serine protease [Burkholderiaceae bacterium]